MAKRKKREVQPELFPREAIEDYQARDEQGRPIVRGDTVRCPAYQSETLGVEIATRVGIVIDVYRRAGGPVLLELRLDRDVCAAGTAVVRADRTRLSKAVVRGTSAEDWHGQGPR